jgi:hypothetical protein
MRSPLSGPTPSRSAVATVIVAALLSGAPADSVFGQEAGADNETAGPVLSQWQISVNPFLILAESFAGEVEYTPGESVGFGLAFSHFTDPDESDESATGINALVRYYPGKKRLRGFYLGGRLGYYSVDESGLADDSEGAFAFGVELGYNWVFGEGDGFYLGLGGGVTRIFGTDSLDLIPIVRIANVGWSF